MGAAALFAMGVTRADDSAALRAESNLLERNAALSGQIRTDTRVIHDFTDFAGSRANASNLVIGLRRGMPIMIAAAPGSNQDTVSVLFTPPARAMNSSSVYISLALAKQQLENLGISQPTPEQITAVLIGGVVSGGGVAARTTTLPGVLTLRSRQLSWASIAESQGVKLGTVLDGLQGVYHDLVALHLHYVSAAAVMQIPVTSPIVNWP